VGELTVCQRLHTHVEVRPAPVSPTLCRLGWPSRGQRGRLHGPRPRRGSQLPGGDRHPPARDQPPTADAGSGPAALGRFPWPTALPGRPRHDRPSPGPPGEGAGPPGPTGATTPRARQAR